VAVTSGGRGAGVAENDAHEPKVRAHYRAALTGTIFAMSVLAYLGDHETDLGTAVVTVAGTGLVIFFAEIYAGLLSASLASVRRLRKDEIHHEFSACSTAAGPGILAALVLLLAELVGWAVQTGITIALWLGVLALTSCSILEGRGSHRSVAVRVMSIAVSVLVGIAIIVLKSKLH
jgi:hypothetical protein